jgi:site-specific DNA recombinase
MKVAVYARVSSEARADRGTIESQLDYLRRYTDLNNLDVVAEYPDEAVTGPTALANRPMGRRLLEDVRLKKFNCVVFYRVDRFARSLYELLDAERALGSLGVSLQSASEPFDTSTPMGRAIFQILGTQAELEKSTIAERTELGRRRIASDGRFPGGPVSFGYTVVDGRLVPSTRRADALGMTEAEVVQSLFERLADGSTLVAECTRLNRAGVAAARGGRWLPARLSRMLRESVYVGEYVYHTKAGPIAVSVPALVDPALRDRAIAQLRRNATNRPTGVLHLLRGKIRCALCGGAYVAQSRGKSVLYYRCARQTGKRGCPGASLRADHLEATAWEMCSEILDDPQMLWQLGVGHYEHLEERDVNRHEEVQRLRKSLVEEEAAKQRVISLYARGKIDTNDADPELDRISAEIGRLHADLTRLETTRSLGSAYLGRLRHAEEVIKEVAGLPDTPENRRLAIEALLQKIEVQSEGEGRAKRARLTFSWLGQAPFTPLAMKGGHIESITCEEGTGHAS